MADTFEWFDRGRFGMFIHWGLFAMGGIGCWQKNFERGTNEQWEKYANNFDPDLFNPEEWAKCAKEAGMKYFVLTAKHHEGFCLFDSKYTDYKYKKKDLLAGVINAFRNEGLRIGVYYSLPDWHHPNYPHDKRHPQRDIPYEPDTKPYTEYVHNQVREILTNYGKIDLLWFDGSYPDTLHIWECERLNKMIRELQPEILVCRLPGFDDFSTPEATIPQQGLFNEDGTPKHWEGCQISHGEWSYVREKKWKTSKELVEMLIRHTSRGGNLLLNFGPTSRGCFDDHTKEVLADIGKWMKWNGKAIHSCCGAPAEYPEPEGCRYTWNPETNRLYVHFLSWPDRRIDLPGLAGKVEYAQLLCDGCEIKFTENLYGNVNGPTLPEPGALRMTLPIDSPRDCLVPVVELILK